jgi:tetratricopeptide (TPR) repeat protein
VGFLSSLFGGGGDDLRKTLFDVAAEGDRAKLGEMCRSRRLEIIKNFPSWARVPDEVRQDENRLSWYGNGLTSVASVFAEDLGFPGLAEQLQGGGESNPIDRWQERLGQAQQLMESGKFREAADLLEKGLGQTASLKGSGADELLPVTLGFLGQCRFHGGEVEKAVEPTEKALKAFEAQAKGAEAAQTLSNLFEIHRWRGRADLAAAAAERLAEATGDGRWKRQAAIVRAGEPLVRVVCRVEERTFELDEAPRLEEGGVQFIFRRNRITLGAAELLSGEAQRHGQAEEFPAALEKFRAAAAADPFDPHVHYLEGLTLLHLKHYGDAVKAYDATERLAPGWFQVRADRWIAQRLAEGKIDHEMFRTVGALVDQPMMPEEKVAMADAAIAKAALPVLHLVRGEQLFALGDRAGAEAALRKGLELEGDPDVRTRLFMALSQVVETGGGEWLKKAAALNGNLIASAQARVLLQQQGSE